MQADQTGRDQRRDDDVLPHVGQDHGQSGGEGEHDEHGPVVDLEVEDGEGLLAGEVEEEPCGEGEEGEDEGEGAGEEGEEEDEEGEEGVVEAEVAEVGGEAGVELGEGDGEGEGGEGEEVAPGADGGGGVGVEVLGWRSIVG